MAKKDDGAGAATASTTTATVVEELPKAIVRRIVKEKLASENEEFTVNKDAMIAFAESARVFIHYLSATANDICNESKRQTINADDVLKALEEIEFPEFLEPLQAALQEYKRKNNEKKSSSKARGSEKKRKLDEQPPEEKSEESEEDTGEDDQNKQQDGSEDED